MNIESTLITNIQSNQYFKELPPQDVSRSTVKLYLISHHYIKILDEIYTECHDLQPWLNAVHKTPSTAFCLLYKLFTLRLTYKQLKGILNHKDSPYIRGLGFLYLRYACDPKQLWGWFEAYLNDEEELTIKGKQTTIGKVVRGLIDELKFCETMLPRIPVPVKREIDAKLKEWDSVNKPTKSNQQERDYKEDNRNRDRNYNYSRDRREDNNTRDRERREYNNRDRDRKDDRRDDRYRRRSRSPEDRYRRDNRRSRSRSRSRDRDRSRRSSRYSRSRSRSPRRYDRKRGNSRSRSRSPYDAKKYSKRSRTPSPPRTTTTTTTTTTASSTSSTPKQPNKDLQKIMSMYNASTSISIASEKLSDNLDPGYEKITLGKKKY